MILERIFCYLLNLFMSDHSALDTVFQLSPRIRILPIRHGSGDIAQEIRETFLSRHFDCFAVPLPPSVEETVEQGIDQLPHISVVVLPEPNEDDNLSHSILFRSIPVKL